MEKQNVKFDRLKSTFQVLSITAILMVAAIGAQADTIAPSAAKMEQTSVDAAAITPMSLVQVLAEALDHNPRRRAAWSAAKAAKARIRTAKSAGGLQVGLSASVSNQWGFGSVGSFGFGGGGGGIASANQGWKESISLDANLPIYSGGKVKANKKVAKFTYQMAIAQAISTEQNLIFNTTLNYLDILRNQQLVDVSDTNLAVAKERHRVAEVRFNAGAAAKLEVLRAATDQATAKQNLVVARNLLEQARANLNVLMGRKPQIPLRIQPIEQLTLPAPLLATAADAASDKSTLNAITTSADLASGEELAVLANTTSPTLAALQAQFHAAEAGIKVAKSGDNPSIGLSLTGLISNPVNYLGRFLLGLGANVVQNLFDSGRTSSQVRAAKATADQLKNSLLSGELSVANQIEQSLLALDSAKERLESTHTAVVAAKEALRAAQLGYSAGVQTVLFVSDAEAALLEAQTNAVNARFDVAASQAQLAAAVGLLTEQGQQAYDQSVPLRKVSDKKQK